MKAKNKKTGEIIDVDLRLDAKNEFVYERQAGKDRWLVYKEEDLDFVDLTDWASFRREAAKDILSTLIEKASEIYELESLVKEVWCERAVEWADELIKQLKNETY